jgi:hypothetical protein
MKFAYADPPYLGRADFYVGHHPEALIWDDPETHRALINRLQDEYADGWAMSLSGDSLRVLLPMCPAGARVATWITDRPRFAGNQNPIRRHCEPVIWCGGRGWETGTRAADFVITKQVPLPAGQPRYRMQREKARKGELFLGRKPREFCRWVFTLLGAAAGDTMDDLFPGTGAVGIAWEEFTGARPARELEFVDMFPAKKAGEA